METANPHRYPDPALAPAQHNRQRRGEHVFYKLLDPTETFRELRHEKGCLTIEECAKLIKVDPGALSRAIDKQRIAPKTLRAIAKAVKRNPLDIARESGS
jgi:hypothetical protein